MSGGGHTIEEAIQAFDDDALFKVMLAQLVSTFPSFEGAPERIREARNRLMRLVDAAPDLLAVVRETEDWLSHHGDPEDEGAQDLLALASAARAKARGEG